MSEKWSTAPLTALAEVEKGMEVLDHIPDGWRPRLGAINHPKGFRWIYNGQRRFCSDYKTALVREELVFEWSENQRLWKDGDAQ